MTASAAPATDAPVPVPVPVDTPLKKPTTRPANSHFSSGPCAKRPGWSPAALADALVGRSHRSAPGKAKLAAAIDETRALLGVPDDHRIAIVPASDTGAVEMAMWTLLGERPVDMLAWESFGSAWVTDAVKQLGLDARVLEADYGEIVDFAKVDFDRDVVFTWNGTTSGVRVPDGPSGREAIPKTRAGLTICDATSAAFAQDLPWEKLDATTFSWQKVMGGEAAHGMLILSPRAVERLESFTPQRPLPKIFRLTKSVEGGGGKLIEGIFRGETINTPSMLCVEDYLDTLRWGRGIGGLKALHARCDASLAHVATFVEAHDWIDFLAGDPATRSNTSVCLTLADPARAKPMAKLLADEGVAFDIGAYRDAPPGLRIWCGATVEPDDVAKLMPWLGWAYEVVA